MIGKVVKISDDKVYIGLEDGSLTEARKEDCAFIPEMGDKVELFQNNTTLLIHKVEPQNKQDESEKEATIAESGTKMQPTATPAININISDIGKVDSSPVVQPLTTAPSPDTRAVVNKIVYCILAFFLGTLGIQKFYAGKTGSGILCIVFCWTSIPTIIGLVDCLRGIFQKADGNGNIVV